MCGRDTLYSVDPSNSLHTPGVLHLIERLPRVQSLSDGYGRALQSSAPSSIPSENQYPTNVLHLFKSICPIPNQRDPTRSTHIASPPAFGDSLIDSLFRPLILLKLLYSMSSPMETLSPPPTIVAYEAKNEERSPSPGGSNNKGPMPIAFDGEGGIPYVQRLVAQVGSGGPGGGESQPSVGVFPSTDIHISFQ